MKVTIPPGPPTGNLLKQEEQKIKEAAAKAGLSKVERGFLNNALMVAKPADAAALSALLEDPRKLVTAYQQAQAAKAPKASAQSQPAAPAEAAAPQPTMELS